MPGMDGIQAANAIRAREPQDGRPIPIVALTAYALPGDEQRCLEAGMEAYLSKPIDPARLFATIDGLVAQVPETQRRADQIGGEFPDQRPAIDRQALLEQSLGSRPLALQMVEMFLQTGPQLLVELRQALAGGDAVEAHEVAHKLKGILGTLAARPAFEAAFRVEARAREPDLESAGLYATTLELEMERLLTELDVLRSVFAQPDAPI
jgi:CheY-like chemotaxis protein